MRRAGLEEREIVRGVSEGSGQAAFLRFGRFGGREGGVGLEVGLEAGVEEVEDLVADVEQALEVAVGSSVKSI